MTRVKVVDASALAAVIFDEPEADTVKRLLDDSYLLAPTLLPYELANVAAVKTRRHPHLAAQFAANLMIAKRVRIDLKSVDASEGAIACVGAQPVRL